jgi:hypothetical protein
MANARDHLHFLRLLNLKAKNNTTVIVRHSSESQSKPQQFAKQTACNHDPTVVKK